MTAAAAAGAVLGILFATSRPEFDTSAAYASLLDGTGDRTVRSAFVPSTFLRQGEVRLLQRGRAAVMQTVLSSRHLKRVVDEIRKKEAASWPAGRRGREDSLRYVDALARAEASVQERSRRQGNRQDRRQGLLIEFILSDRESLVAISEPEVEEDGNGHFLVASKRPMAVLPLSRTYVRGNFYEIAGDALGLEGTEAAELLEPLLPPGAREGAEAPAEGKTGK
jgi:hypothetical protein